MAGGYQIYRDRDGKAPQREYVETAPTSEIAGKDAEYIRARLPPTDRVWYEWGTKPQDVPLFDVRDLGERPREPEPGA